MTNGSFEDGIVDWEAVSGSPDPTLAHDGQSSLKLAALPGCGGKSYDAESKAMSGLSAKRIYVLSYWYRYAECSDLELTVSVGESYDDIALDGTSAEWTQRTFEFSGGDDPTGLRIGVELHRLGVCADFSGPEFQNDLIWLDDFKVTPRP